MRKIYALLFLAMTAHSVVAQKSKQYYVKSPDGNLRVTVDDGAKINWSVRKGDETVIAPSAMSLTLGNGDVLGCHPKILSAKTASVSDVIKTAVYKKKSIDDNYNQLTLQCKGDYGVVIRAYNDG